MTSWPHVDGDTVNFEGGHVRYRTDPARAEIVVANPHSGAQVFVKDHDSVRVTAGLAGRRDVGISLPPVVWNSLLDGLRRDDPVRAELKRSLDDALSAVERLSDDRDHWQQEAENQQRDAELWKSLAQRQDNTAPLRMELRDVRHERDEWKARYEGAQANAEYVRAQYGHPDEVEELREAVVRQAREISRLTEERE